MLTWISEKGAKWVVYIFGAGILVGLLSLGQTNLDHDTMPPVAKVDGDPISVAQFRQAYDGALAQYSSTNLREEDRAQIRSQVLDQMIRSMLTRKQMGAAQIHATITEMKYDLLNHPPEEWKQAEIFLTDSLFDEAKWQQFVANDSVYDQSFMVNYELYLKNEKIPSQQLQAFVSAGYHATDAEALLALQRRANKMSVEAVLAPIESFVVDPSSITEEEINAAYKAQPDSFWAPARMARFEIAALPVVASAVDEADARSMLDWIAGQMEGDMSFDELARTHSADEASAEAGGSLGGYQPLDRWVPEFATAARDLEAGQISPPIRSSFGWHLVRCNGKRITEDGVEEADLSHILVKMVAGNQTLDSLRNVLQVVSDQVTEKKVPFADAVKQAGLEVISTPWMQRGDAVPGVGAVSGLASYGFADKLRAPLSKIIENENWMLLAKRVSLLDAGARDFSLAEEKLRAQLVEKKQIALAEAHLAQRLKEWNGTIDSALVSADGLLRWSSAEMIGQDGYLSGLGIASPVLQKVFQKEPSLWSEPLVGDRAVVVARVTQKEFADPTAMAQELPRAVASAHRMGAESLISDWVRSLEVAAKVERNLDLYFSE